MYLTVYMICFEMYFASFPLGFDTETWVASQV
jgi:hypothetical protein